MLLTADAGVELRGRAKAFKSFEVPWIGCVGNPASARCAYDPPFKNQLGQLNDSPCFHEAHLKNKREPESSERHPSNHLILLSAPIPARFIIGTSE